MADIAETLPWGNSYAVVKEKQQTRPMPLSKGDIAVCFTLNAPSPALI
jgi:hypothetical protein